MTTLAEAKVFLREHWEDKKAAKCPCCGQTVKLYKRRIHWSMAVCLIKLYHLSNGEGNRLYFHVNEFGADGTNGGDFAKLAYWGLISEKVKEGDEPSRTSGIWMITAKGIGFVHGTKTVPEFVRVFDGKVVRFEGEPITIQDALGNKFNYQELMNNSGK